MSDTPDKRGRTALYRCAAKPRSMIAIAVIAAALNVAGDEKLPRLKVGSEVYTNVTITEVTTSALFFTHAGGVGSAKLKNLEPELQKHFNFDPGRAHQAELQQAQANAEYHAGAVKGARTHPAAGASTEPREESPTGTVTWGTDLPRALARARAENKSVLLLFDGSDWCPTSALVNRDILSTDEFRSYARAKLVLVLADFPRHIPQTDKLKEANERLSAHFNIKYYPTFILLNPDAENLGGVLGYTKGGPSAFIAKLERFRTR